MGYELDLLVTKKFYEHDLKYGMCDADINTNNTTGGKVADVDKTRGWVRQASAEVLAVDGPQLIDPNQYIFGNIRLYLINNI
ncbi:MAG TPA: hypothetical protein VLN56_10760 [Gammaproteobacteria bacterium]|nr:hypothetical protein [Gammaproteobacteria bacterium]